MHRSVQDSDHATTRLEPMALHGLCGSYAELFTKSGRSIRYGDDSQETCIADASEGLVGSIGCCIRFPD
jgi:hypothetical protein